MQVTDEQRLDAEAFIGGIAGTREAEPAGSAPSAADNFTTHLRIRQSLAVSEAAKKTAATAYAE